MKFSVQEIGLIERVLWRDHCPGAAQLDGRVINYLMDVSIQGQVHTSGAQVARCIGEHPRSVTTSLLRLERDGIIERGLYNHRRCSRLITIPVLVEASKHPRPEPCIGEPSSAADNDTCHAESEGGFVHAGWAPPADWMPKHWFEVFDGWGCTKEMARLPKSAAEDWVQIMRHCQPSDVAHDALLRGCRINKPLEQAPRALFTWTSHGPVIKEQYCREPGTYTPALPTGQPIPMAAQLCEPTAPAQTAPPTPQAARKARPNTPPPPSCHTPSPLSKEREEAWDVFFGEVGEDFRDAQRFLDANGWALFQAFLVAHEPRQIESPIRDAMIMSYRARAKGDGNVKGIAKPLAFIARQLSWNDDGTVKAAPKLVGVRRKSGLEAAREAAAAKARAEAEAPKEELTEEEKAAKKAERAAMFAALFDKTSKGKNEVSA